MRSAQHLFDICSRTTKPVFFYNPPALGCWYNQIGRGGQPAAAAATTTGNISFPNSDDPIATYRPVINDRITYIFFSVSVAIYNNITVPTCYPYSAIRRCQLYFKRGRKCLPTRNTCASHHLSSISEYIHIASIYITNTYI